MSDQSTWGVAFSHLPDYLGQHVLLSLSALALGLSISLPLAVLASRSRLLRGPTLAIAGIAQTIPGLALVALFYPLLLALSALTHSTFGFSFRALGFLPALLALTLYSMLPVLQNTITALAAIDPAAKAAARGVGMTPWQSLWIVELPLAAPVIVAGIRTATAWVIGAATLATPIGQTSLGNYIFTGLQTENWVLVLFGCIAAASLSLTVDRLLALFQEGLARRSRWRLRSAMVGLAAVVAASLWPTLHAGPRVAVVGSNPSVEQYILASLIQDRLHGAGIPTAGRTGLGTSVLFDALSSGDVDVAVAYSGTVWTNEMHRTDRPSHEVMLDQLKAWLWSRHRVLDLGSLGFQDQYVFAMRSARTHTLQVASIGDLVPYAPQLTIGGDLEVFGRPEWRTLIADYGLHFGAQREFQSNFLFGALMSNDVDVLVAYSTDGRLATNEIRTLSDPKGALPPYDALLLVSRRHAHDARFLAALAPLVHGVTLRQMQRANYLAQAAIPRRSPADVARILSHQIAN